MEDKEEYVRLSNAIENIYYIFNFGYLYPSIFDIIFGFNIYQTERFLNFENFFSQDVINTIQVDFYECSEEIFKEIFKMISYLLDDLKRLNRSKEKIEWIKSLCENSDYYIVSFYNKIFRSWDNDKQDIFYLFLNITKILLEKLEFLFFKEWEVIDSRDKIYKIKLVEITEFDPIYQKIYNDFLNLKSKYFANVSGRIFTRISLEDYLKNDNFLSMLDDNQKLLYEKMLNLLFNFKYISDKLSYVSENLSQKKYNEFNNYLVYYPDEFKSYSILEVINEYIKLLLQISFYFKEKTILSEINKLQDIIKNIKNVEDRLNRMSDTKNFIRRNLEKVN